MSDLVLHEPRPHNDGGTVHWLIINREERRNALNADVMAQMSLGALRAISDPDARAIVITGIGDKAFCAGGDLNRGRRRNALWPELSEPQQSCGRLLPSAGTVQSARYRPRQWSCTGGWAGADVCLRYGRCL